MTRSNSNPVSALRMISLAEAISYLVLLAIAMPLKYLMGLPLAVKIVGTVHGALFVVFCFALLRVILGAGWPLKRAALVFVASLIPFAPFCLDVRMKKWVAEFSNRSLKPL